VAFWDAASYSLLRGVNGISKKPPVSSRQRSWVGTVTSLGVATRTNRHTTFGTCKRVFFYPKQPDRPRIARSILLSGRRRLFPEGKAARALSWPIASVYRRSQQWVEVYHFSLLMPPWCTQRQLYFFLPLPPAIYTGCPRRNVPDFGRVFLMLKYTDITQNTYVQSWTGTEIMAREKCGLLWGSTHCTCQLTVLCLPILQCGVILRQFSSRYL
jgi:hypothetical protein